MTDSVNSAQAVQPSGCLTKKTILSKNRLKKKPQDNHPGFLLFSV